MVPPQDTNHGPTVYKIFTSRVGLSLTVSAGFNNFTTMPVSQAALRQQNQNRSSVIVLLGRQLRLASKGVGPSGEG